MRCEYLHSERIGSLRPLNDAVDFHCFEHGLFLRGSIIDNICTVKRSGFLICKYSLSRLPFWGFRADDNIVRHCIEQTLNLLLLLFRVLQFVEKLGFGLHVAVDWRLDKEYCNERPQEINRAYIVSLLLSHGVNHVCRRLAQRIGLSR